VALPVHEIRSDDRVVIYADQEAARVEAEVHAYLRRIATALGDVPVEFSVRFGDPVAEIVREAADAGVDLIAMASHRRRGLICARRGRQRRPVDPAGLPEALVAPRMVARGRLMASSGPPGGARPSMPHRPGG
jgi:hypothetical protein